MQVISGTVTKVILTVCVLTSTLTGVSAAATGPQPADQYEEMQPEAVQTGTEITYQQNNTTVRHRNPDDAESEDSSDALRRELAGRLSERLEGSTVNLTQGQYERARSLLGNDYDNLLSKYADVADETGDEQSAERFRKAKEQQRAYTDGVATYQQKLDAYRKAKQKGNEERARALARELTRLSTHIAENASKLDQTYETIGQQTTINTTTVRQQTEITTQRIIQTQTEVAATEFVQTTLTVDQSKVHGSFSEELTITGQLKDTDDASIDAESVQLQVGSQQQTVELTADGRFSVNYRPTSVSLNKSTVTVRYLPEETSIYLGSNSTVDASLVQEEANVTVTRSPSQVTFGDAATIQGFVAVNDTRVPRLPVVVYIGDVRLGEAKTNSDGIFTVNRTLGLVPPTGNHSISVRSHSDDLAVRVDRTDGQVRVDKARPRLAGSVKRLNETRVRLTGQLTGPNGTPVSNQPVAVFVNESYVSQTQSGRDGNFTLSLDTADVDDENVSALTVRFTGQGANLAAAKMQVKVPTSSEIAKSSKTGSPVDSLFSQSMIAFVLTCSLIGVAGAVTYVRGRKDEQVKPSQDGSERHDSDAIVDAQPMFPSLDSAHDAVRHGNTHLAVNSAYTAVRVRLTHALPVEKNSTHWQFFEQCVGEKAVDEASLRELTSAYEQAKYGREAITEKMAMEAIDAARVIVTAYDERTTDDSKTNYSGTEKSIPDRE